MATANFIIGGAQRSGTTFLWQVLDSHPAISMAHPLRPEPKFFLRPRESQRREDYAAMFASSPNVRWYGEKSTSYLERSDALPAMRAFLPEVRLIFVLRDPVERALSNYRFSARHGVETLPLEAAILGEDVRRERYDRARFSVSPFAYEYRGHYVRFLRPWIEGVGRDRVKIVLFEELIRDPRAIQEVCRWLDIEARVDWFPTEAVNDAPADLDVPLTLRHYLASRFRASNDALAQWLNLDLSGWQ